MKQPDPILDEHWFTWRIVPALDLDQAAALLTGNDPAKASSRRVRSSEVEAMTLALAAAIKTEEVTAFELYTRDYHGELESLDPAAPVRGFVDSATTVRTSELASWADLRGIPHYWGEAIPATPSLGVSRYPDELRAAIEASEAVHGDPTATAGKSPKTALAEWLKANKRGLSENARERVATVANWQREGGAPKTPTGKGG